MPAALSVERRQYPPCARAAMCSSVGPRLAPENPVGGRTMAAHPSARCLSRGPKRLGSFKLSHRGPVRHDGHTLRHVGLWCVGPSPSEPMAGLRRRMCVRPPVAPHPFTFASEGKPDGLRMALSDVSPPA